MIKLDTKHYTTRMIGSTMVTALSEYNLKTEIKDWLKTRPYKIPHYGKESTTIYFENPEDEMLFKLTWC